MSDDPIDYYTDLLARRSWLSMALCWTVVESLGGVATVEAVVERLGSDPADLSEQPWDAALDLHDSPVVHVAQVGRSVTLLEINGFQGSMRPVLERLSQGARVHSAYWNVNALSALSCAAFGHLLVTFEGLFPDERTGLDVCALDEELDPLYSALRTPGLDFRPAIMAIVERRTGVRLGDDWLAAAARPAIVLPPPDLSREHTRPGVPGCFFDPELESAVWLAPVAAHDAMVGVLVEAMAAVGQLGTEPEVAAALSDLRAGLPRGDARYAPLQQLAARLREESRVSSPAAVREDPAWRRSHAAAAVWLALLPPAHTPFPLHCLRDARLALGDDWLAVRARLHSHLRAPAS